MALLYDARYRAFDTNGDPMVGATLTIYDANTTTPTAIFLDAALSVPATNPTSGSDVSDAGGWFPQLFAAEGTNVDITLKTSAGATVKTYVDVVFLGADTGDFTRTVSGNGRFKITGSAGAVLLQAGDPSPDNTGGTLTIEGWAGTQLDTLTLDAATTNTTGALTVGGKKLTGVVQTAATTFTAAANVDIELVNTPTGVIGWRVMVWFTTAAATSIQGRFSYDGSTYKSGANDYGYGSSRSDNAGTTLSNAATVGTVMNMVPNMNAGANRPALLEFTILTPTSGSDETILMGQCASQESASVAGMSTTFTGYGRGGYGRATNFRLLCASTLTGKYRVSPIYGLGE